MSLHLTRRNQPALLSLALTATHSTGWRADAVAMGAYAGADSADPVAVAVFQAFEADAAELHFGMIGAHRMGPEIVKALVQIAFHHRGLNLRRLWTLIHEDNVAAQVAALKVGFRFEHRKRSSAAGGRDAIVFAWERRDTPPVPVMPPVTAAPAAIEV